MRIQTVVRAFTAISVLLVALVVGGHLVMLSSLGPAARQTWTYSFSLLSLGASVLLLLALLYYVEKKISQPLSAMTSVLKEIQDGYLDVRSPAEVAKANTELGALARTLDKTLDSLVRSKISEDRLAAKAAKKKK